MIYSIYVYIYVYIIYRYKKKHMYMQTGSTRWPSRGEGECNASFRLVLRSVSERFRTALLEAFRGRPTTRSKLSKYQKSLNTLRFKEI